MQQANPVIRPPAAKPPSIIWRLLRGGWRALNFSRRLLLNLVFLLILFVFASALFHGPAVLANKTALVIAPQAVVVEQYSQDASERALARLTGDGVPEVQLRDLLRAIDSAGSDPHIDRILLRPDAFYGAGYATLRELGEALKRFRAQGKEVVAYADYMEQKQYYLAAFADEVYLNPEGLFWLEGLAVYRSYFREAIEDRLGAQVHLFKAGEYKSYGETYVRDSASPESLEADRYWVGDVWQRFLADIAGARGLDAGELQSAIDRTGRRLKDAQGDFATLAKDQGLVDDLLREDEVEARLIERGAADDGELRAIDLEGYLGMLDRRNLAIDTRPQVAILVAEGEVVDGDQPRGVIGGRSTAALVRDAREDDAVKALVVRVNSPGGSAFASEQVRRELELTRQAGKPVVVSMGDVAASGGYWIALGGDRVFADPSTITGSIGVFGMLPTFPATLAKLGVHVDGIATSEIAGGLDPRRPLKPEVGAMFQAMVDKIYHDFIALAASVRERSEDDIDAVARGRVWTGQQALERGLIDELGGLQTAVDEAARRAELAGGGFRVQYIEAEPTPWERFLADLSADARTAAFANALGVGALAQDPATRAELGPWLRWLRGEPGQPKMRALAYCNCSL